MTWQKLNSKEVYKNRYMRVTEDEVLNDDGDKIVYGVVHKEPFAIIIPWDGEKTVLVSQYRYVIDTVTWEFPMGHKEPDQKNVESTALTELHEETGLIAKNIIPIGSFYLGAGHHTQVGHVFVATDYVQGERSLEKSEKGMKMKRLTLNEITHMIEDGTIKDGPTIVSFKFFELYLAKHV